MNRITTILEAAADGTLHLPVPPALRHGKLHVTAVVEPLQSQAATPDAVSRRQTALRRLRDTGGLRQVISDPLDWQRQMRADRNIPGRP